MNDRPTPETDAVWDDKSKNILEHARRLERERDEAREEIAKLHEVIRSEWPADQAEELIKQCKQ